MFTGCCVVDVDRLSVSSEVMSCVGELRERQNVVGLIVELYVRHQ